MVDSAIGSATLGSVRSRSDRLPAFHRPLWDSRRWLTALLHPVRSPRVQLAFWQSKDREVNQIRVEALTSLLDELEALKIDLNQYYGDLEPQGVIDAVLTGKIDSLRAFCQTLGWSDLVASIRDVTPLGGNAVESLEVIQSFVIPEARRLLLKTNVEEVPTPTDWFWELVHPGVGALARRRFEAGFFGDAVEASFKEVNDVAKRIVREVDGRELDGARLMNAAFSPNKPLIRLTALATETDRNIQQGYMQIMAGAMIGIRNPKAHGNLNPSASRALHLICLASLLMHKIDERIR